LEKVGIISDFGWQFTLNRRFTSKTVRAIKRIDALDQLASTLNGGGSEIKMEGRRKAGKILPAAPKP
jgi:hypothetical protein